MAFDTEPYDAIIVGAGAAGVGMALVLQDAGVKRFLVLERHLVGASFGCWPAEIRFITPSFPTNSIGMLDLNSIALGSSPAHVLGVEHPTGLEYAAYLNGVAQHFQLPIHEEVSVNGLKKEGAIFHLETNRGPLSSKHVIWAAGEFQFPKLNAFSGSAHCIHTAFIPSYREVAGDDFVIIGGYESGIDAAYHLALRGKKVRIFDEGSPWTAQTSDPSVALSTYTMQRMRDPRFVKQVELIPNTSITEVQEQGGVFKVITTDGHAVETSVAPLLAGGFVGGFQSVSHFFESREDGFPVINEQDESTITPGLLISGPAIRHENHVFCFIYKYRQRFAVVAKTIANSLDLPAEKLETYRQWGMYLDDLSCCGDECVC